MQTMDFAKTYLKDFISNDIIFNEFGNNILFLKTDSNEM